MELLVIYDETGHIWQMMYDSPIVPKGLLYMYVTIPEDKQLDRIDVTDPNNPQPVFVSRPISNIDGLKESVAAMEEQLTQTQMALTELYEGIEV